MLFKFIYTCRLVKENKTKFKQNKPDWRKRKRSETNQTKTKRVRLHCSETAAQSYRVLQIAAINRTKIALKSQQVYKCDIEVAASARQKFH